ncbi:Histone transcription regulator 3 [Emmonsiellopsis sp. PD_33]|nr:Histone transcription regulator 3 [Emmonsiellopsis sp. PD_33]
MASFVALNIEPDEDSEEEIDDTKEIQIEEALKLYHNALKLHSQGPQYYDQASEAYDALFQSEIFNYPESISEYKRSQLQLPEAQDDVLFEEIAAGSATPLEASDTVSSALPQTIYLSYKNRGQFVLDKLKNSIPSILAKDLDNNGVPVDVPKASASAIRSFGEALERDDTDLELWRKSARIGEALQSHRLARYCLESVLEGDDDLDDGFEQLGLEQAFAGEDLRQVLNTLCDKLSISQRPLKRPRKAILRLLQKQIDPFPFLPTGSRELGSPAGPRCPLGVSPRRHVITPTAASWTAIGQAILRVLVDEQKDNTQLSPGAAIGISLQECNGPVEVLPTALPIIQRSPIRDQNQVDTEQPHDVEETDMKAPTESDAPLQATDSLRSPTIGAASTNLNRDSHPPDDRETQPNQPSEQPSETQTGSVDGKPDENDEKDQPSAQDEPDQKTASQSRKRSSASAGHDEHQDGGRVKSRRIRARESNAEVLVQPEEKYDWSQYFADRLDHLVQADEWMFGVVGPLLSKVGVEDLGTADELRNLSSSDAEDSTANGTSTDHVAQRVLYTDLRDAMLKWNDEKAHAALQRDNSIIQDGIKGTKRSGLNIFLEHSRQSHQNSDNETALLEDDGLSPFLQRINNGWCCPQETAWVWLEQHLKPNQSHQQRSDKADRLVGSSTYTNRLWPKAMKETVTQILVDDDEFIYNKLNDVASSFDQIMLICNPDRVAFTPQVLDCMEITESIYELHLDIYAAMNGPDSDADSDSRALQRDRLSRWSVLSRAFINYHIDLCDDNDAQTAISLRHMWTSVFHFNLTEEVPREPILQSLHDLKDVLALLGNPSIPLLNNATIPEISVSAIDKEVSRLNSMDFFMNIFGSGSDDPVHLIESIEPILEPSSVQFVRESSVADEPLEGNTEPSDITSPSSITQDMISFLDRGDATLRLFLWRRLKGAYESIQYPPKVISCYLRSIEVIMEELRGPSYLQASSDHRQMALLRWIKAIDGLLSKVVVKVQDDPQKSFECFDMDHLKSSMSAIARLSKFLHSFVLFEDWIKVGKVSLPEIRPASTAKSLEQFREKLRGMQIKAWVLQYTLLRESMEQNKELFDTPYDDRIHYLRSVHNAVGIRCYCKYANKILLKLMKTELLTLPTEDGYEFDISQLLFDLYGLKFLNLDLMADHGCPIETLDRPTAVMLVDFVMMHAKKISINNLPRSYLKLSIDTIQMSIGWATRFSTPLTFNKRVLSAFLKSPINPSDLFRAVQGVGEVSMVPVHTESVKLADKGWYFLLGSIAFAKFRTQKKPAVQSTTDDLDLAASFFRQELEHGSGKWETWYRLAQVYDVKLDEDITWSADKLNNGRPDLATLQRRAIHCYAMAVAAAIRTADSSSETKEKVSKLYTDFGCRIYASATEPLSMEAFSLSEFSRHYSSGENQRMYKSKPFRDMKLYSAWNFASYLFRRAMVDLPNNWKNHYMFSKCLWKMFGCSDAIRGNNAPVEVDDILDSLTDAIEALPSKKDSRSEPILEPHFKLVSIVHKLVHRGSLKPEEASERLLVTPWAQKVTLKDGEWKPYILEVLKNLRNADKSNWHHRIVARAAHVMYDDLRDDASAIAAKHELTQQIFTKTMTLQVWRPENERAGRHFVYTTRYVYFFVGLLDQLNDRVNMDMLIRRIRRKTTDYVNLTKLWEDVCLTYIKLFRRVGEIPEGHEDTIFKPVSHDDFVVYSGRLENWCHSHSADMALVDLLKDAVELKKLNNGLMKSAVFEDLVADTYAVLYQKNIAKFMEQVTEEESRDRMKVDHLLMGSDGPEGTRTPPVSTQGPGPKPRFKGVARKELQRKAEAIATRALAPRSIPRPAPRLAPNPTGEEPQQSTNIEVAVPVLPIRDELKEEASGVQSSVPGSVHDSADDESELSDIDEDLVEKGLEPAITNTTTKPAPPQSMFPNLLMKRVLSPKPGSDPSTNVSVADERAEAESLQEIKSDPDPEPTEPEADHTELEPTEPEHTELEPAEPEPTKAKPSDGDGDVDMEDNV